MSYTKEQIQNVRDISIANMLSVNIHREKTMIRCPMPDHNDGTASFLIDSDNGYHCFGCDKHGRGYIDFATDFLVAEGMSEEEAFKQIMNEYTDGEN